MNTGVKWRALSLVERFRFRAVEGKQCGRRVSEILTCYIKKIPPKAACWLHMTATHLSKTSRLRVSLVLVGVLRVFWRSSTFFFRLCGQRNKHNRMWAMFLSDVVNSNTSCVDDILTEISLSAQDRSICTDFMSSLFWLISSATLCN